MEAKASVLSLLAVLVMATTMMGSSRAYDFYVGGRQGWVPNPSEGYNSWAGRNRFQVNDRLVFRYKKGEDSVLVVNETDYRTCNTTNPLKKLDGGDSVFQFDRSGPFFFISGVPGRCQSGEKLLVVVLAVRGQNPPANRSPSPSPSAPPPSSPSAPVPSPSPSGAPSPSNPQPSPAPSPSTSPALPPTGTSPAPASAGVPVSSSPTGAPSAEFPFAPRQAPSGSSSRSVSLGTVAAALLLGVGAAFRLP